MDNWMTNGCVLDNISRPHRQRSNAARKLNCFSDAAELTLTELEYKKRWHGLLVAQKVNKRYLTHWLKVYSIPCFISRYSHRWDVAREGWDFCPWGYCPGRSPNVPGELSYRPTLSAPKTLLVIHCPHRCEPICSLIQLSIELVQACRPTR